MRDRQVGRRHRGRRVLAHGTIGNKTYTRHASSGAWNLQELTLEFTHSGISVTFTCEFRLDQSGGGLGGARRRRKAVSDLSDRERLTSDT